MEITSIQVAQTSGMFKGFVSEDIVLQALKDAQCIIEVSYDLDTTLKYYDLALRYYACHTLYMAGHIKEVTSKSVGDVSVGYSTINQGDKESTSPYLSQFQKLVDDGGIFVSI